jgi:MscS family membrane protein
MRLPIQTLLKSAAVLIVMFTVGLSNASAQTDQTPSSGTNSLSLTNTSTLIDLLEAPNPNSSNYVFLRFGLDEIPALKPQFMGNPRWQYVAFFVYVVLAYLLSKVFDLLLGVWLKAWTKKTKTDLDDILIELLRGPAKIIVFVVLLNIGLKLFAWPAWAEGFINKGFLLIVAFSITYLLLKMVDLLLGKWAKNMAARDPDSLHDQLLPILRGAMKTFIVVIAVLLTSDNLGMNITSVLASLSVVGLALGLAAQDTVANLFGAATVFLDKPFKVGDRVQLDSVDGMVEQIGIRSTRVRNLDGHLITVPNKTMGNATITNVSRRPNIKTVMNIGVTYDTPTEKVQEALAILAAVYKNEKTENVWISFNSFAASSLNIVVIHWFKSTDYKEYLDAMQAFNMEIKTRFDSAGIGFAFPTQTLYLKQDSDFLLGQQTLPTGGDPKP